MSDSTEVIVGRIVKELAGDRWVINLGVEKGLAAGARLVVFLPGDEIVDPDTGESLGALEEVKCHVVVEHAQPRMAVVVREGPPPEAPRVLSAVLADTSTGRRPLRAQPLRVGDHVRLV
ncbi:MAG: hypothetical protein H6704_12605 [Myxococcales bacterium]|nr:hypothetical protein [Myxococcales bacterium]